MWVSCAVVGGATHFSPSLGWRGRLRVSQRPRSAPLGGESTSLHQQQCQRALLFKAACFLSESCPPSPTECSSRLASGGGRTRRRMPLNLLSMCLSLIVWRSVEVVGAWRGSGQGCRCGIVSRCLPVPQCRETVCAAALHGALVGGRLHPLRGSGHSRPQQAPAPRSTSA